MAERVALLILGLLLAVVVVGVAYGAAVNAGIVPRETFDENFGACQTPPQYQVIDCG